MPRSALRPVDRVITGLQDRHAKSKDEIEKKNCGDLITKLTTARDTFDNNNQTISENQKKITSINAEIKNNAGITEKLNTLQNNFETQLAKLNSDLKALDGKKFDFAKQKGDKVRDIEQKKLELIENTMRAEYSIRKSHPDYEPIKLKTPVGNAALITIANQKEGDHAKTFNTIKKDPTILSRYLSNKSGDYAGANVLLKGRAAEIIDKNIKLESNNEVQEKTIKTYTAHANEILKNAVVEKKAEAVAKTEPTPPTAEEKSRTEVLKILAHIDPDPVKTNKISNPEKLATHQEEFIAANKILLQKYKNQFDAAIDGCKKRGMGDVAIAKELAPMVHLAREVENINSKHSGDDTKKNTASYDLSSQTGKLIMQVGKGTANALGAYSDAKVHLDSAAKAFIAADKDKFHLSTLMSSKEFKGKAAEAAEKFSTEISDDKKASAVTTRETNKVDKAIDLYESKQLENVSTRERRISSKL